MAYNGNDSSATQWHLTPREPIGTELDAINYDPNGIDSLLFGSHTSTPSDPAAVGNDAYERGTFEDTPKMAEGGREF